MKRTRAAVAAAAIEEQQPSTSKFKVPALPPPKNTANTRASRSKSKPSTPISTPPKQPPQKAKPATPVKEPPSKKSKKIEPEKKKPEKKAEKNKKQERTKLKDVKKEEEEPEETEDPTQEDHEDTEPDEKAAAEQEEFQGFDENRTSYDLKLIRLNEHITCKLCKGYLIDATTIIECCHTFCKSCILSHFEGNRNDCPTCGEVVHQSHPSHYVAFDRQMQDIVYRLVPGLFKEEKERRLAFIRKLEGLPEEEPKPSTSHFDDVYTSANCAEGVDNWTLHRRDAEMVTLKLLPGKDLKPFYRNILRVPAEMTIKTLKKYVSLTIYKVTYYSNKFDIFCNNELMGKDYSMQFIKLTRWRKKDAGRPVELEYRNHIEFL